MIHTDVLKFIEHIIFINIAGAVLAAALECLSFCLPVIILSQFLP